MKEKKEKKDKTNLNVKIDSSVFDQLDGLAKFMKVDRNYLLEMSVKSFLSSLEKETEKMKAELEREGNR